MTPSLERPVLVLGGTGQIGFEVMRALSGTPVVAPPRAELDLSDLRAVASYLRGVRPRLIVKRTFRAA